MGSIAKLALSLTVLVVSTAPALAADGDCRLIRGAVTPDAQDDVSVCRQDTWFHQASTKLGNGVALDQAFPSWSTTKPTASISQGAGAAYLTNSVTHQTMLAEDLRSIATFDGSYTGVIDNLAIEIFGITSPIVSGELNVRLVVDSWTLLDARRVKVTPQPVGDQRQRFRLVLTNVYEALKEFQHPGGPDTSHRLRLAIVGSAVLNDPIVFEYDSADSPSGMVFNQEAVELGSYTEIDVAAVRNA